MEWIMELLLELVLEGTLALSQSRKVPFFIRCFLIALIVLFFVAVIALIFLTGYLLFEENVLASMGMLLLGIFMLVASVMKFRKVYLLRK